MPIVCNCSITSLCTLIKGFLNILINLSSSESNMFYNTRNVNECTQDRERATWSTLSISQMKLVIIEVNIIKRLISLQ